MEVKAPKALLKAQKLANLLDTAILLLALFLGRVMR